MDNTERVQTDDFAGKLPVLISDQDLKDVDIEVDDTDLDASTGGGFSQDASQDVSATPEPEIVSRATPDLQLNDDDGFDPNSETLRQERVREREALERLEQERVYASQIMRSEIEKFDAERARAEAMYANVTSQAQILQEQLAQAVDDENAQLQIAIQSKLNELRQAQQQIEGHYRAIPTADMVQSRWSEHWTQRQREITSQFSNGVPKAQNQTARDWQDKNGWMANPKYKGAVQDLLAINDQLVREGFDAEANSFYRELAARLKSKHPDLPIRDNTGRPLAGDAKRGQSGPPVASARSANSPISANVKRSAAGKPVVTLDATDFAIIRSMRRDPTDKAFIQRYAKEKYASQQRTRTAR